MSKFTHEEVRTGILTQSKKHPGCMISCKKWDSYEDKPFSSWIIETTITWRAAKGLAGDKCWIRKYTKKEIEEKIKEQYGKHTDCLRSAKKWDSYEDKPFWSKLIKKVLTLKYAKELVGAKYQLWPSKLRNQKINQSDVSWYSKKIFKQEVEDGIRSQFKKHPDCMDSAVKWASYKDAPFGISQILKFLTWKEAKNLVGKRYSEKYTKCEIEHHIKRQVESHPDCLASTRKWDSYEDKPFTFNVISKFFYFLGIAKCFAGVNLSSQDRTSIIVPILVSNKSLDLYKVFSLVFYDLEKNKKRRIWMSLNRLINKCENNFSKDVMFVSKKYLLEACDKYEKEVCKL